MHRRVLRLSAPLLCLSGALFAASHRNGPLLLEDQTANLNDFYIFRSYETGKSDRLVMSMSAQGFQNPDNGPSYYKFSDSVLYRFSINNSRGLDGNPDINIDFTFQTTLRENNTFLSYLGPITSIDSPGILLYQTYSVVVRNMKTGQTDHFTTDKNGHCEVCHGACVKQSLPKVGLTTGELRGASLQQYLTTLDMLGLPGELTLGWVMRLPV